MNILASAYGKVNLNALDDSAILRLYRRFPEESAALANGFIIKNDWRYYKNFQYHKTEISLDWTRSQGRNFFDVGLSINKFLFGGVNTKTYSSKNAHDMNIHLRLNVLKELVRRESGRNDLNVFNACFVRKDVGLAFPFKHEKTARNALDYIGNKDLPRRPAGKRFTEDDGYYWNNPMAYEPITIRQNFRTVKELEKIRQPTRCFVAYLNEDDKRILKLETRHYQKASIQGYCDNRELKNNLANLTDFDRMNAMFWGDALPLFSDIDQQIITQKVRILPVS